ncbi:MAG: hypothetical protein R3B96_23890 [Pirellulaceae bacterium]
MSWSRSHSRRWRPSPRSTCLRVDFQQAIRDYRNHLESITLAERAQDDLQRAEEGEDYSIFSRAVFGFEESLALWSENRRAEQGLLDARLRYARLAKAKGDFDLATSLLDASVPEHQEVLADVQSAIDERSARERRLTTLKRAALAMAASMFVVITAALLYVINANRNERIARDEAELAQKAEVKQRKIAEENFELAEANRLEAESNAAEAEQNAMEAEANRLVAERNAEEARLNAIEADSQRAIADKNAEEARQSAMEALEQRRIAIENEEAAVEATRVAELRRQEAVEAQMIANQRFEEAEEARRKETLAREAAVEAQQVAIAARDEAQRQREIAEYEAYVARINAAAAKIDEQNFDQARSLLAACRPEAGQTDYRDWEWNRLWYLCHQSQRDLALDFPAESIRFAPDASSFVVGGLDGSTQIRDLDGELIQQLPSSGSRILAVDWTGAIAPRPNGDQTLLTSARNERDRSPGWIAVGSDDRETPIQLFDAATGERISLLDATDGHTDAVTSLQFSADGTKLLSASFDRTVKLWDLRTGRVERTLVGHRLWVWSARFSPDEQHIASASEDGTVRIWNAATGEASAPFLGHQGPVYAADFSDDGRWVASGGIDGLLLQWSWDPQSLAGFDHRQAIRDFQAGRPIESRTLRGLRVLGDIPPRFDPYDSRHKRDDR